MKKTGRFKQVLALILAGALIVGSVGIPVWGADFGDTAVESAAATTEIADDTAVIDEFLDNTDEVATEESRTETVSDDGVSYENSMEEEDVASDAGTTDTTSEYAESTINEDKNIEQYTVTLDANGGYFENVWDDALNCSVDFTETLTRNIPVGGAISVFPVREQDGVEMSFLGWSLEQGGELLTQDNEEYVPVENCVLYAVWEIKENIDDTFNVADNLEDISTETEDDFNVSDYNNEADTGVESEMNTVDSETASEAYTDADAMKSGLIDIAEEYFAFVYTGYDGTYVVDNIYYTGSPVYPYIMVTSNEFRSWIDNMNMGSYGGMVLIGLQENEDYTVSYSDNIEVGEATVTITGTGHYTGTIITHFEIEKAPSELAFDEEFISKTIDDVPFTNPLSSVSDADVVFYSDNEDVASVDVSTGMVTIHAPGSTIIRAFVEENDHFQSGEAAFLLEVDGSLGEDITWFLDGDGTLKISGTGRVYAFGENHPWDNNAVSTIMILGDIQNIPDYAFKGCLNLGEVYIPYSVTEIGQHAFDDCPNVHFTCEYDSYAAQYASEHGITHCDPLPAVDPVFDDPDPEDPPDRPDPESHDISYCTITLDSVDYTYDGIEKEPSVTVYDGGTILSVGTDYTVEYKNNINAGTATVTISGAGDYSGTKDEYFNISRALPVLSFSNSEIEKKTTDNPFTNALTITTDGSVSYVSDNPSVASVDVNTGNVTIQGKAGNAVIKVLAGQGKNYAAGTAFYTLKVTQVNLSGFSLTLPSGSLVYNGQAKEPTVTVKNGTIELIKGTDYTASYSNNVNVGTATCTVTGINKYKGSASITFTIKKADPVLSFASTSVSKKTTDSAFTNTLTKKTDGTVTFSSSNTSVATVNSSSGLVTIKGAGNATITANAAAGTNYNAGSASYGLTVSALSLSDCTMTISPTSYTYDGTEKKPTVTIKNSGTTLINNTDYTVSYTNNTNAGTGTVTATGKGSYSGSLSKTFTISKASPTLSFASSSVSKTTTDSAFTNTLTKTTDGTVTFSSSNTSVATVNSSSGLVTINGAGSTTITANTTAGTNYNAGSASYEMTVTDPVNTLDLSDLSYSFGNHWDYFGYSKPYRIPLERYQMFFSKKQAEKIYEALGDWGGNCYGMSSTSGMFNTEGSGIIVENFKSSAKRVSDLSVQNRSGTLRLTVTELIEALQVSQQHFSVQKAYNENIDINKLCNEVKKTQAGNPPVVISVLKKSENGWRGHSLLGYKIEKINSIKSKLYVYDCNFPNQIRTIDLTTNITGEYTGWDYFMNDVEHYKSGNELYKITFIPYSVYQGMWSGRIQNNSTNMLFVNANSFDICDYAGNVVASMSKGVFSSISEDVYEVYTTDTNLKSHMIYLPTDVYQIVNKDSGTPEFEVTTVNVDQSATVTTSAGSVLLAVDDESEMNIVSVEAENGESYSVSLSSELSSAEGKEEIEYSGVGNGSTITVGMTSGNCILTNCTGISMWINGEMVGSSSEDYQTSISTMSASLEYTTCAYDGTNKEPAAVLRNGSSTLRNGIDYVVIYNNNINPGTASATLYGIGSYTGTITKTFTITPRSIDSALITGIKNKTYVGKSITQEPVVKVGDTTLIKNTDYKITYKNNIYAGTATITITGKGNYTGSITKTFKISKAEQSITAKASASSVAVGKTVTVSISGAKGKKSYTWLKPDTDTGAVSVDSTTGKVTGTKVGIVTIKATSKATDNFNAATKKVRIKVVPAATTSVKANNLATGIKLTWKKVTGATGYLVYRGSTKIATIKSGSTVTYTDTKANTNGGKYIFKIIPTSSYGNGPAKSLTTYRVTRPAISSVTNSVSKKMTVKWGENAKGTGYQIHYCTDNTFKSGNKSVSITSASTVSKVIGSLTKGKTYYVRIRTYKTVGSTKYFSAWSPVKNVKVR